MKCPYNKKDLCALSSPVTSQFCVENGREENGVPLCSIYKSQLELEETKKVLKETQEELKKERAIKAEVFNTLFSIHDVYLLKKKDNTYQISLVINGEICSWDVDENSVMEGAYSAIPIRQRNIWKSHI